MLSEIVDEEYKKQIMFLLNNNWTGRTDYYFPVQISINVERSHFSKLKDYNYVFAKKNTVDTKRAILFTFLNTAAENTSVIILKDLTIYNININCSYEYFYGSIFDVSYSDSEIVIHDSFMTAGNKINAMQYTDRLCEASYFISNIVKSSIPILSATYVFNISEIPELSDKEEIFMIPNNLPITTGINYSCFKWKPPEKMMFSLMITEQDTDINLYTTNFKKLALFATIKENTENGKSELAKIKELANYKCGCVVDFNISEDKITAISVSDDKTIPTTIRSIEKILHIKRENITLLDLINM